MVHLALPDALKLTFVKLVLIAFFLRFSVDHLQGLLVVFVEERVCILFKCRFNRSFKLLLGDATISICVDIVEEPLDFVSAPFTELTPVLILNFEFVFISLRDLFDRICDRSSLTVLSGVKLDSKGGCV